MAISRDLASKPSETGAGSTRPRMWTRNALISDPTAEVVARMFEGVVLDMTEEAFSREEMSGGAAGGAVCPKRMARSGPGETPACDKGFELFDRLVGHPTAPHAQGFAD